jgi:IS30 family transposase
MKRVWDFESDSVIFSGQKAVLNTNICRTTRLARNTDLSKITQHDIYIIQEKLNNRPRKCLWYLSPNEFFYKKTWVKPN